MAYIDTKLELLHLAFALRRKSGSLIDFDNVLKFIGLGIAPLMILAGVQINNPVILALCITLSGILSLTNWIGSIGSLVFRKDQHIDICKTYPLLIDDFFSESDMVISIDKTKIQYYTEKANTLLSELKKKIEQSNLQVQDWINIQAQQQVLIKTSQKCGSCNKTWNSPSMLQEREIKKIAKNKKLGEIYCLKCAQRII